jgi:molybdopterin synthase sulfur carrier subunit
MRLNLVYFAWVRERIGKDGETLDLDALTVGEALAALRLRGENYIWALAAPERLRFALDQEFVEQQAPLREGAELAIFPPVTGG